jgi:hypothetical protein
MLMKGFNKKTLKAALQWNEHGQNEMCGGGGGITEIISLVSVVQNPHWEIKWNANSLVRRDWPVWNFHALVQSFSNVFLFIWP